MHCTFLKEVNVPCEYFAAISKHFQFFKIFSPCLLKIKTAMPRQKQNVLVKTDVHILHIHINIKDGDFSVAHICIYIRTCACESVCVCELSEPGYEDKCSYEHTYMLAQYALVFV